MIDFLKNYQQLFQYLRDIRMYLIRKRNRFKYVSKTAYIVSPKNIHRDIKIGSYSFIGKNCRITIPAQIGKYVLLAQEVAILGEDHITNIEGIPIIFTGRKKIRGVYIEDDCWIGYRSIIMDGVKIEKGSIVAAGAVVTKNVEPYTIVAGVPAKKISDRFTAEKIAIHNEKLNNEDFEKKYSMKKSMRY